MPTVTTTNKRTGFRNVVFYGETLGTGGAVDELDDGATMSLSTPTASVQIQLSAEGLMSLTRQLADIFDHIVVHSAEWREKLAATLERVMSEHESRCLDDETDRRVVIDALVAALNPRFVTP